MSRFVFIQTKLAKLDDLKIYINFVATSVAKIPFNPMDRGANKGS